MTTAKRSKDGAGAFDFLMGRWKVTNRRLRQRLAGCREWVEFDATNVARPLADGLGNEDEFRTDFGGGFTGMSFRFYDPCAGRWAIYWADSRRGGLLDPPVVGSFVEGVGTFQGADVFEGRPIVVRFVWSRTDTESPRWEQAFSDDGGATWETNWIMDFTRDDGSGERFPVIELRRYTTRPGAGRAFAAHFDSYFPEAFRQLDAAVLGQFVEPSDGARFTWLRGYRDLDARKAVCTVFYDGPLWREHRRTINDLIVDSDDVLLLHPVDAARGIPLLPPVDAVSERDAARGVVAAQIFAARPGRVEALLEQAEPLFAQYRALGARESGVLRTLEVPNDFPRHPVREDGPYLVWLGVLADGAAAERLATIAEASAASFAESDLARAAPELVLLDPTPRSRLRWR